MALQQILKFQITCDGLKPNGFGCPCDIIVEASNQHQAEALAETYGWRIEDRNDRERGWLSRVGHRGWLCNARDGHRGD